MCTAKMAGVLIELCCLLLTLFLPAVPLWTGSGWGQHAAAATGAASAQAAAATRRPVATEPPTAATAVTRSSLRQQQHSGQQAGGVEGVLAAGAAAQERSSSTCSYLLGSLLALRASPLLPSRAISSRATALSSSIGPLPQQVGPSNPACCFAFSVADRSWLWWHDATREGELEALKYTTTVF